MINIVACIACFCLGAGVMAVAAGLMHEGLLSIAVKRQLAAERRATMLAEQLKGFQDKQELA